VQASDLPAQVLSTYLASATVLPATERLVGRSMLHLFSRNKAIPRIHAFSMGWRIVFDSVN
jgi:hypothetical protein